MGSYAGVAGKHFFADELEKLLALPLETQQDVEEWYAASKHLQERLKAYPDLYFEGETYHYLVDADIRRKDPGYRRWQEDEVRAYIRQARQ